MTSKAVTITETGDWSPVSFGVRSVVISGAEVSTPEVRSDPSERVDGTSSEWAELDADPILDTLRQRGQWLNSTVGAQDHSAGKEPVLIQSFPRKSMGCPILSGRWNSSFRFSGEPSNRRTWRPVKSETSRTRPMLTIRVRFGYLPSPRAHGHRRLPGRIIAESGARGKGQVADRERSEDKSRSRHSQASELLPSPPEG